VNWNETGSRYEFRTAYVTAVIRGRPIGASKEHYDTITDKTRTSLNSATPLGRLVYKAYNSRYLAAHYCTTNDFRTAFKFRGFFGSTPYAVNRDGCPSCNDCTTLL